MSKTRSAIDAAHAEEEITDEVIDAEWERLNAKRNVRLSFFSSPFRKIAAMFVGIIILSGIAFAAIQWYTTPRSSRMGEEINIAADTLRTSGQPLKESEEEPVVFDNVALQKMLPEIAAHYGVEVVFKDETARQVRLFFQWRPQEQLKKVVRKLNHFESIHLQLESDTLFVSSTLTPQS